MTIQPTCQLSLQPAPADVETAREAFAAHSGSPHRVRGTKDVVSVVSAQWVDAPDVSAVADYFRESPWKAEDIMQGLEEFTIADLLARAEDMGIEPIISASLDDSTTHRDKDTSALEAVEVTFDHSVGGKGLPRYCKAAVHVTLRVQVGPWGYTFSWRL